MTRSAVRVLRLDGMVPVRLLPGRYLWEHKRMGDLSQDTDVSLRGPCTHKLLKRVSALRLEGIVLVSWLKLRSLQNPKTTVCLS